jgi:hypothetical protein
MHPFPLFVWFCPANAGRTKLPNAVSNDVLKMNLRLSAFRSPPELQPVRNPLMSGHRCLQLTGLFSTLSGPKELEH